MEYIDIAINGLTVLGIGYVTAAWFAHGFKKPAVKPVAEPATELVELEAAEPDISVEELIALGEEVSELTGRAAKTIMSHVATLTVKTQPTDLELIVWAKANKWPGARKWGKNRKLSQRVRAELLEARG